MFILMIHLFAVAGGAAEIPTTVGIRTGAADDEIVSDISAKGEPSKRDNEGGDYLIKP
jgi:hypothetical protein